MPKHQRPTQKFLNAVTAPQTFFAHLASAGGDPPGSRGGSRDGSRAAQLQKGENDNYGVRQQW